MRALIVVVSCLLSRTVSAEILDEKRLAQALQDLPDTKLTHDQAEQLVTTAIDVGRAPGPGVHRESVRPERDIEVGRRQAHHRALAQADRAARLVGDHVLWDRADGCDELAGVLGSARARGIDDGAGGRAAGVARTFTWRSLEGLGRLRSWQRGADVDHQRLRSTRAGLDRPASSRDGCFADQLIRRGVIFPP